ncbi:hypothetical protein A2691_04685 [Candidatus Woesebacteria bacterium RIFCSPHIGHO2_01_FULL_39_23]|nr:MAG: hypothetical protein A2691_04685 [Candidatus Woesebacteria bacterium RIFCSPHIGHO2_01_FULL_39_23]
MSFSDLNIKDTSANKGKIPSSHRGIMPLISASKIQAIPETADNLARNKAPFLPIVILVFFRPAFLSAL